VCVGGGGWVGVCILGGQVALAILYSCKEALLAADDMGVAINIIRDFETGTTPALASNTSYKWS
jgi:hypothetical protein